MELLDFTLPASIHRKPQLWRWEIKHLGGLTFLLAKADFPDEQHLPPISASLWVCLEFMTHAGHRNIYSLLPLVFYLNLELISQVWDCGLITKSAYLDLSLDRMGSLLIIKLHCVKFLYWYHNYIIVNKNTELFTNVFLKSKQII